MQISRLIPFFKKDARDDCDNYRPITITDFIYKLLAGKPALLRVGVRKELSCEGRWFRQCRRRDKEKSLCWWVMGGV